MFVLENESYGHGVHQSQWSHSMANINLYKSHIWAFFASFYNLQDMLVCSISNQLRDIHKSNKMKWKWRSRSKSRRMWLAPFDWKCLNPYRWFSSRILATWEHTLMQKVTHTRTHTHTWTHSKSDDYRQNLQSKFA